MRSVCISIDTPPEQANRESNLLYGLPEWAQMPRRRYAIRPG
jgi:hypothetical protein